LTKLHFKPSSYNCTHLNTFSWAIAIVWYQVYTNNDKKHVLVTILVKFMSWNIYHFLLFLPILPVNLIFFTVLPVNLKPSKSSTLFETSLDLLSKWIFSNLIVEVSKNCLCKMLEERTKKFETSFDLLPRLSLEYLVM
jgi:hypothetical protein